jgi:hypothetical protein
MKEWERESAEMQLKDRIVKDLKEFEAALGNVAFPPSRAMTSDANPHSSPCPLLRDS